MSLARLVAGGAFVVLTLTLTPPLGAQCDWCIPEPPSVAPKGGTNTVPGNQSGRVETFWVENPNGQGETYNLACTWSGTITSCSVPGSVYVGPYQTKAVNVTYATGATGTATLSLEACSFGCDDGWYTLTIDGSPPDIRKLAPTGDVAVEYPTIQLEWCDNLALNAGSRWITVNGVDRTGSFDYVPTGGATGCAIRATSTTASVALVLGSNQVDAHICDGVGTCTTKTFWITRRDATAPGIALLSATTVYAAYPPIQLEWCDNESLDAASRWIKVNGADRTGSFDYVTTGGSGGCAVRATSTTTTVALNVGANAVEGRICDSWGNCTVQPFTITRIAANAPVPAFVNHNRDHHARALCLTAAAGDAAQVQCGDLMAYHGMPAFRSLTRARSLTLVYNSATAEPRPRVAAHVQVQSTVAKPQSIYAQLTVSGVVRASATYAAWDPGQTRQIVLAFDASGFGTGLYPFSLMTRSVYPDATYDATISDTLIVVNREGSAFGAGWYLAGVEQLVLGQPGNTLLWVAGDGSARVYRPVATDQWQAPAGAYRDTIVKLGTTYERRAKHGVTVTFDAQGRHIRTHNRLGHVTQFVWNANGQLIEITVPGTGGE